MKNYTDLPNYDNTLIPDSCFIPNPIYIIKGSEFGTSDRIDSYSSCEDFILNDLKYCLTHKKEPPQEYKLFLEGEEQDELIETIESFRFFSHCSIKDCNNLIFNPSQYYKPKENFHLNCSKHSLTKNLVQLEWLED